MDTLKESIRKLEKSRLRSELSNLSLRRLIDDNVLRECLKYKTSTNDEISALVTEYISKAIEIISEDAQEIDCDVEEMVHQYLNSIVPPNSLYEEPQMEID